jgi:hypothetical protein
MDTSVTAWNELYQIETFLTPKTVVPGAESVCRRIAGSGRGKLVTTSCSGSGMAFLERFSSRNLAFLQYVDLPAMTADDPGEWLVPPPATATRI